MALRVLLSAKVLEVSLILYLRSFLYFSNFANGSERKGLSAFTGKFLSSTAVFRTQVVSGKKSRLVLYRLVESFHAITIDAKHLYFTVGVSSTLLFFLREINRFLETLSSFWIFETALFLETRDSILETRDSILETRSSNVSSIEARESSLEVRVSSVNLLLSGTVSNAECSKCSTVSEKCKIRC